MILTCSAVVSLQSYIASVEELRSLLISLVDVGLNKPLNPFQNATFHQSLRTSYGRCLGIAAAVKSKKKARSFG